MSQALSFDAFKTLLLAMAQERSVARLLELATRGLAKSRDVALARIWLVNPGSGCDRCVEQAMCTDRERCLQLVATAGRSVVRDEEWSRTNGAFRRVPMGHRKVGQIALSAEALEVEEIPPDAPWVRDRGWIEREGIVGVAGQPLVHHGRVLGVLAVFTRVRLAPEVAGMLRMVSDHLASALVNAWAFEDIQQLRQRLEAENAYLRREMGSLNAAGGIAGESAAIRAVRQRIEFVAPTDATVLILGESGTGKELVATEIHARSKRRDRALVKVNCAAIPKELFESEFFGHAKGSFTGAAHERTGLFGAADGGTIFLDEVSEIPVEMQGKLLRVLQEGEFRRVGEERVRKVEVRVIAATNRDLGGAIEAGTFRPDLYYRLAVFPIEVPPLRERPEDISALAQQFVERASRKHGREVLLRASDVERLAAWRWPGNCRELQNVIERAVITSNGDRLDLEMPGRPHAAPRAAVEPPAPGPAAVLSEAELRRLERQNLLAALERSHGRIYGPGSASELLGIPPTTLVSRLKKLGIERSVPGARSR